MNVYFTKDHEWIRIEGGTGIIGITEYAANQLGDITFVELPKTGKAVKAGDILCSIESVKAASDVFSPLSGVVDRVNNSLEKDPGLVNRDPEHEGWIASLKLADPAEKSVLMDRQYYDSFIKGLI